MDVLKLKAAIVRAGYNQRKLADKMGMSKNTLNAKVNGKSDISLTEAIKFSKILNINTIEEKGEIFLS